MVVAGESQGEWVWVDTNAEVAIGARLKVTPSGQRLLVDDEGKVNTGVAQNPDVLVVYQASFETQFDPHQPPAGAQSVPGAGGLPPGHAPDSGRGCGRHDQPGGGDRGRPPQKPDAATQAGHHLRKKTKNL